MVPGGAARASDGPPEKPVKWLADENLDNDILRGICRRTAGFDVVRVQDVPEISGSDDPAVLAWATAPGPIEDKRLVRAFIGRNPITLTHLLM